MLWSGTHRREDIPKLISERDIVIGIDHYILHVLLGFLDSSAICWMLTVIYTMSMKGAATEGVWQPGRSGGTHKAYHYSERVLCSCDLAYLTSCNCDLGADDLVAGNAKPGSSDLWIFRSPAVNLAHLILASAAGNLGRLIWMPEDVNLVSAVVALKQLTFVSAALSLGRLVPITLR